MGKRENVGYHLSSSNVLDLGQSKTFFLFKERLGTYVLHMRLFYSGIEGHAALPLFYPALVPGGAESSRIYIYI